MDPHERPVPLAVDQEFGEGATLRVAPVGLDRADALEIRERKDMEKPFNCWPRTTCRSRRA
jgi:hypothetical protein